MAELVEVLSDDGDTTGMTRVMTLYFPTSVRFMAALGEALHFFYEHPVMLNRDPEDTHLVDIWVKGHKYVEGDWRVSEFDPYEEEVT